MTCFSATLTSIRPVSCLPASIRPITATLHSCRMPYYTSGVSSADKGTDLGKFHRNEHHPINLNLSATTPTSITDISGATATLQVWDYSGGVPVKCFEKTNGAGITIINAEPTALQLATTIDPTDYTGMIPQLPAHDVKLQVIVWVANDGIEQVVARGYFVSKPALDKD